MAIALLILSSCHGTNDSSSEKSRVDSLNNKAIENVNSAAIDSSDVEPSPNMGVTTIFRNAGLAYLPGLTNSIKEVDNYNSSYSQELNVGVYCTDLLYCTLNKHTREALDYLKVLQILNDRLGFGSQFNTLAKRYKANINSEDSIAGVFVDMQLELEAYLNSKHEKYVEHLIFVGAWVEGMYIGSKSYSKKSENVGARLSEQMEVQANLIKLLNSEKSEDTHIIELISLLKASEDNYNGFDEVKKYNPDSEEPIKLSDAHINELGKEIMELREKLVNPF